MPANAFREKECKNQTAVGMSCWGAVGHQSAVRQPEGPGQLWAASYCRNATQGGLSAQSIKFLLSNMISRASRCFSRRSSAHTAVQTQTSTQLWVQLLWCLPGISSCQELHTAWSYALNELFYVLRVTASSRGIGAAQQSSPAATLLKRITVGTHPGLNVQYYQVQLN